MRKPPCKGAMGLPSVHLSSRVGFALLFSRALLACECIRAPSLHPAPPCSRNILEPRNAALRNCACDRTSGESTPAHGRAFVFLTAIGGGLAVEVKGPAALSLRDQRVAGGESSSPFPYPRG